jgi:two-component system, OmpR family, sensor kinase
MSETTPERGLALLSNSAGQVVEVLRNDLRLTDAVAGRLFIRLVDGHSRIKAMNFLTKIKEDGAAFDWELNVAVENSPETLHFSGGLAGEYLLIVGAANSQLAARLYEDMLRISNEQTNRLRAALKENALAGRAILDTALFDEISRLNNDLVAMQRELAKKNAELERLNQEKNHFLGMAAHDLRNPLYVILVQSEYLLEETQDPQTCEVLESIHAASEFLTNLVNNLLDVAQIEAGQLQLDLWAVDLGALATKNIAMNRFLAAKKQTQIDLAVEPLPSAIVDGAKIEQVLNNLISNAVKFSPPGSRVEVSLKRAGENFCLVVRDQGPGIPPEEQARLFQPFSRGRVKGTAGEKNTGLGLMIAKRIVASHGGKIWLESASGQGTTFFVSIPFQPPEERT